MNPAGIDPKWVFYLGVLVTIQTAIGQGAVPLTNTFPETWIPFIKGWSQFLGFIGTTIMTALSGFSSKQAGPLAKSLVLGMALGAALFLFNGSAQAETPMPKPRAAATTSVDPLQQLMDQIAAKKVEFVTNVVAAIQEADDDAATLTNPADPGSFRDPIAHACYPAQIKFLQSLPQVQAIKAPTPYNVIVLFQRKRDLVAQIKQGLPGYLKVGCAALLQDEKTILLQTLGLIGVTVGAGALTGAFPAVAPITLPALAL